MFQDRLKDAERERTELRMKVAMLQHQQSLRDDLSEDLRGSYAPHVNTLAALPRQQSVLPSADAHGVVVGVPVEAMQHCAPGWHLAAAAGTAMCF